MTIISLIQVPPNKSSQKFLMKHQNSEANEVSNELVYRAFDNVEHKGELFDTILSIICITRMEIKKSFITMKFMHIAIE